MGCECRQLSRSDELWRHFGFPTHEPQGQLPFSAAGPAALSRSLSHLIVGGDHDLSSLSRHMLQHLSHTSAAKATCMLSDEGAETTGQAKHNDEPTAQQVRHPTV